MNGYLDFEKPIVELEKKIADIRDFATGESVELSREIAALEKKLERLQKEIYSKLTRWQRVQLARHPKRPTASDYIKAWMTDFVELHGDRGFADDHAVITGLGKLDNLKLLVVAQEKGKDTKEKLHHNFGMMHPEGYRKALRTMQLAARFGLPILVLIDTPGAFPGVGAEERGQAEAIARNLREMAVLPVPIVVVILGEGASGGALGVGIGDRILMLENAWYSVISPEGCAAILWRDSEKKEEAAEALKLASFDLLEMGIIDKILPEPLGGAHRDPKKTFETAKTEVLAAFGELSVLPPEERLLHRIEKYRSMGRYTVDPELEELPSPVAGPEANQ
ncbi:MAG: acetyl-CoA carboxylase carboxyltransferase subunit alpha [candidate division Zixibacteria bacterium]|nr:acetyl-CoA carboxylase carboxyltransferase subunit alpha [candidate division Zixibacteria bacterium]